MGNIRRVIINDLIIILVSIIVVFIMVLFVTRPYKVISGSMQETIDIGDRLLTNNFKGYFLDGKRGDVVLFVPPYGETNPDINKKPYITDSIFFINEKESDRYVKRIIGIPGDTIDIKDGKVYVNGEAIKEDYLEDNIRTDKIGTKVTYPLKLEKDEYFVMGDNRNNSSDSRVWGILPADNIVSYPILIFYPFENRKIL